MTVASAFLAVLLTLFVCVSAAGWVLSVLKYRALPKPLLTWQSRHTLHYVALPVAAVASGLALALLALKFGQNGYVWAGLGISAGALFWVATLVMMHRVRVYSTGLLLQAWNPMGFVLWSDVHDYVKTKRGATRFTFFMGRIPQQKRVDVIVPNALVPVFEQHVEQYLDARYDVEKALRAPFSAKQQPR